MKCFRLVLKSEKGFKLTTLLKCTFQGMKKKTSTNNFKHQLFQHTWTIPDGSGHRSEWEILSFFRKQQLNPEPFCHVPMFRTAKIATMAGLLKAGYNNWPKIRTKDFKSESFLPLIWCFGSSTWLQSNNKKKVSLNKKPSEKSDSEIFLGRKIWQVFWGWLDTGRDSFRGIQNNLKIRGSDAYPGRVQSVCEWSTVKPLLSAPPVKYTPSIKRTLSRVPKLTS